MRKILGILFFAICLSAFSAYGEFENDSEVHKVVGRLYSLISAVELNGKTNPDVSQLRKFFEDPSREWQNSVRIAVNKNSIWVGIELDKQSAAKRFLRSHSELGFANEPEGYEWIGGDFVWLKAADVIKGKLKPVNFFAAESEGEIFLSDEEQSFWWLNNPDFDSKAAKEILKKHSVVNPPELHKPSEARQSIYESVKPRGVIKVPDEIHMGTKKSSFDTSIEIGDVNFNPIPNMPRR